MYTFLQVGYDQHSFGYRDLEGVKVGIDTQVQYA